MGIFDIFSSDSGEQAAARAKQASDQAANQGFAEKKKYLTKGTRQQVGSLTKALAPFEDIYGQEQEGRTTYMDALGLNGPEAAAAARAKFSLSPGFDIAEQGILRNRAAIGGLRSGQTGIDLADYEWGQQWNPWLDRLQGNFNPMNPAQARAGVLTNIGNAYGNKGVNLANAAGSKYDALGQAGSQYAQDVFGAQQGANQNAWGAIGAGLGLGTKLLGMYGPTPNPGWNTTTSYG